MMNKQSTYRVIGLSSNIIRSFRDPWGVGSFLLGRRLSEYLIIKSDNKGNRLIEVPEDEYNTVWNIESFLAQA